MITPKDLKRIFEGTYSVQCIDSTPVVSPEIIKAGSVFIRGMVHGRDGLWDAEGKPLVDGFKELVPKMELTDSYLLVLTTGYKMLHNCTLPQARRQAKITHGTLFKLNPVQ